MIKGALLSLLLAVAGACSDGTGPSPLPPGTAPTVDTSVGFGDPPVSGTVTIRRQDPSEAWSFSVDLDSDGDAEASGEVGNGADVPFEFTSPGIHEIRIELALGGSRFQTERLVIVNDREASEVIRTVAIPADEMQRSLEGITIGQAGTGLELYTAMSLAKRVFRLDPLTLEVQAEISLVSQGVFTLEGMDLDPTGEFLYVVAKNQALISLAAQNLTLSQLFGVNGAAFTVHALSPGMVLTGGEGAVSLVDTSDGTIVNARQILGSVNFAVSPAGTMLALIQRPVEDRGDLIRILSVPSLSDLETIDLPEGFQPWVVAFKPSGERLYVLGQEPVVSGRARFIVIDTTTAEIVTDQPLQVCGLCLSFTIANPYATSFDGRFVIFPTGLGAYLVDTSLDLPLFRTGFSGCCNVASSPTTNEFYFAGDGEVSIVRLNR